MVIFEKKKKINALAVFFFKANFNHLFLNYFFFFQKVFFKFRGSVTFLEKSKKN